MFVHYYIKIWNTFFYIYITSRNTSFYTYLHNIKGSLFKLIWHKDRYIANNNFFYRSLVYLTNNIFVNILSKLIVLYTGLHFAIQSLLTIA